MTIAINYNRGAPITAAGATGPEPQPKAFETIVNGVLANIHDPKLKGFDTSRINGQAGVDLLYQAEGGEQTEALKKATTAQEKADIAMEALENSDAGHGVVAAKNATLWVAHFSYETHEPMQAVLSDLPANKIVTFNVICTPSSHYGTDETAAQLANPTPTPGSKRANFEDNARNNPYTADVFYQGPNDPAPKLLQSVKFKVADPKSPEYATVSPDITVDLSQFKGGKLIINGYCSQTSAGGYIEARSTVINLA